MVLLTILKVLLSCFVHLRSKQISENGIDSVNITAPTLKSLNFCRKYTCFVALFLREDLVFTGSEVLQFLPLHVVLFTVYTILQ